MSQYTIGLDFGTNSCRCIIIDINNGKEISSYVHNYKFGKNGVITSKKNPLVARQHPKDYTDSIIKGIKGSIQNAGKRFNKKKIIGIGIDTTGSSPMPIDSNGNPLVYSKEFSNNINSLVWLWKDHTSYLEAEKITEIAKKIRPEYLQKCGEKYSSEWFWSKIWHLKKIDPILFKNIYSFVEICDYLPAYLSGNSHPSKIKRSACAAGHKAMFNYEWGGLPDKNFLKKLDPELAQLRDRLYDTVYNPEESAGNLSEYWSKKLGLNTGIKINIGGFDAHIGAIGAGIKTGKLVKIMGTSTCDIVIQSSKKIINSLPGICGIVENSVMSNHYGIEAGQSAVGDIFASFINNDVAESYGKNFKQKFKNLEKLAEKILPGKHGLLALDWHNGNRTILVDTMLTGLILGKTLNTKPEEMFKALIEATAFGCLKIINQIEKYKIKINEIIAIGGLTKSSLIMQVYADVTGRKIKTLKSNQVCAVGAGILASIPTNKTNYNNLKYFQKKMSVKTKKIYKPKKLNNKIYSKLYALYSDIHDAFVTNSKPIILHHVMKDLIRLRDN